MKYGSVCSGIEAATSAWHGIGWTPSWFAEIEPFPAAVLAHHYPDVANLGDMTTIARRVLGGEIEAPEVLVGGTPCQAFSVAGLRQSLSDERGNLTIKYVELADAIDHVRTARGEQPSVIVWENVPGVLSTGDNAFGCFLGALAGADCELQPAGKRWTDAGCVYGPKRAIAWRILDAQYFGLAQRRRRVFVVASARAGFDPAAVLLEWDGLRRDSAPRREAREGSAGGAGEGAGAGRWPADVACTLNAAFGSKQGLEDQHAMGGAQLFVPAVAPICASDGQANASFSEDCAPTLTRTCEQPYVAIPDIVGALTAKGPAGMGAPEVDAQHYLVQETSHTLRGEGFDAGEDGTGRVTPLIPAREVAATIGQRMRGQDDSCADNLVPVAGADNELGNRVVAGMQVRRLTPVECERLQGFPDNHTRIPWRKKDASECPDGPRYKALGNSMAVPVMRWIGQRIDKMIAKEERPS